MLYKYKLRTYIFDTQFFREYVSDVGKNYKWSKYERVKYLTSAYKGLGNTLFDVHDQVMWVTVEKKPNKNPGFKLIVAYVKDKLLLLYDPLLAPDDVATVRHGIGEDGLMQCMADYIDRESCNKGGKDLNVKDNWKMDVADCTGTESWDFSGLYVCYYVYQILKGSRNPFFNAKGVMAFGEKVLKMAEGKVKK